MKTVERQNNIDIQSNKGHLMNSKLLTPYQSYIHLSRYARWDEQKKRRETWQETVDRYINFFSNKFKEFPRRGN